MNKYLIVLLAGLTLSINGAQAESASLSTELNQAIERGRNWLASQQGADGAWEPSKHPAITAMVLDACHGTAARNQPPPEFMQKGYKFLRSQIQPDGGIYGVTNHQNYNTSWSLMALAHSQLKEDLAVIQKARPLLVSWQVDLDAKSKRDHLLDGGFGYGDGTPRANLANTLAPLEALYETGGFAAAHESKLNREMLVDFLHRTQNFPAVNHEPFVCDDAENGGGFMYYPGKSFAGEIRLSNGQTACRSYGSMTCAGLLCYFYAGVNRKAPEVQHALDWMQRRFTVEENPFMGQQGLFYYYHLLSQAFDLYDVRQLKTADGKSVDWREALGRKLLSLQKPDGSWQNPESRWMEDNPVLCTAYSLMALKAIAKNH